MCIRSQKCSLRIIRQFNCKKCPLRLNGPFLCFRAKVCLLNRICIIDTDLDSPLCFTQLIELIIILWNYKICIILFDSALGGLLFPI